ncbi:E6 [human papillomavirus 82]|uniref:Protein E6 n=1 Tax=Human papillomavirus 82 TaxID=129724 RepID=Q9IR59_HPV82|nr:early protein E6 [human papillomavirus 82]ALJ32273.1 early protein E6 [human papillomavirus 82]ALJ32281.1 early protein E6 [human papillomavirus 82]ALJ32289.1 early protein E6 [human papillomavirus 82]ALJ32297.1 early protein E6 [human papillomavirus 82]
MFEDIRERPRTLHELCEACNTSMHNIQVLCVYCKKELCRADVYNVAFTELRIVYRDNTPYAACKKCLMFYSRIREYRRYSRSVYGATLEAITNKSLYELLIRCHRCQRPLGPEEKQKVVDDKKRFHEIAGRWTGQCANCRKPPRQRSETQV